MNRTRKYLLAALILFLLTLTLSKIDFQFFRAKETKSHFRALSKILESDTLIVIHDHNIVNYFSYRGTVMGFHYDMAKDFARHLGLKLKVVLCNNIDEAISMLNNGEADLIAMNLTVTPQRAQKISFTRPYSNSRPVLVQRKPKNWQQLSRISLENQLIRVPTQLAGKEVYVQEGTVHEQRIRKLIKEICDTIYIRFIPGYNTEQLISMVANGEIDYTISDEDVAMLTETFYENLDIQTPLGIHYNLAWAVAKGNTTLLDTTNSWLEQFIGSTLYNVLYNKYFLSPKATVRMSSEKVSVIGGKISPYDEIIKEESKQIGWDWQLLASLIYQESRFNPDVVSWTGAFGLMQLMPETGRAFGVNASSSAGEQIKAGVRFIKQLDNIFRDHVPDSAERLKFILAAYNVGPGHVLDAMRLAKKYNKNPQIWTYEVDSFLLRKSKPKYYLDSVVMYGYCRGEEPYLFVNEILDRYYHYKQLIP